MCEPCRGRVVLRTACGCEQVISMDCDVAKQRGVLRPMYRPVAAVFASADDLPTEALVAPYREFRWRGRRDDSGAPVLEEVVATPKPVEVRMYVNDKAVVGAAV